VFGSERGEKAMRIKVHCIGIVDFGTRPLAVLASDIKAPKSTPVRYVLVDDVLRSALSELARSVDREWGYYGNIRPDGLPLMLASHAWDAHGNVHDDEPIARRTERWGNACTAWVRANAIAPYVLNDFKTWREANPRRAGSIWAPSWNVLVAVQVIALGAGLAVPTADGVEAAS
jgi:hypothetical protein